MSEDRFPHFDDDDDMPRFIDGDDDLSEYIPPPVPQYEDIEPASLKLPTEDESPPEPEGDVLEEFIAATRERWEPEPPPPPPRETVPAPETQSGFVNPALARIASARPSISRREASEIWLALRTIFIVLLAGLVVSFIFSYWTPEGFLSQEFVANLQEVSSTQGPPTAIPSPLPTFASVQSVGIITGHSGPPLNPQFSVDPGAVCDENGDNIPELTELDINTSVALRLANLLVEEGYVVDLLNEWDPRLDGYRASVLVSIHTNTCENLGFGATGFNVQTTSQAATRDRDIRLGDCLAAEYANATGLARHFGSPPDLVDYHVFREVSVDTPTAIVELGFMFADRNILTQQPDVMAQGVYEGLRCFLDPNTFVPTQAPPSP
jgi:N-acetylmuramoyl-L-alanine amidase